MTAPAEHPVSFSSRPMEPGAPSLVEQVLADLKPVTRRICNPQPPDYLASRGDPGPVGDTGRWGFWAACGNTRVVHSQDTIRCPYGRPGDTLWVREAHWLVPASAYRGSREDDGSQIPHRLSPCGGQWAVYRAGWTRSAPSCRLRPSIHMHRWASRIDLRVLDVRLERLQAITEADALAEGLSPGADARGRFARLWDRLNGGRGHGWDTNPWVWRVEFARIAA